MQSIGPLGGVFVLLVPTTLYGTLIYGLIQIVRSLQQISRDISDINETLRRNRSTPTV